MSEDSEESMECQLRLDEWLKEPGGTNKNEYRKLHELKHCMIPLEDNLSIMCIKGNTLRGRVSTALTNTLVDIMINSTESTSVQVVEPGTEKPMQSDMTPRIEQDVELAKLCRKLVDKEYLIKYDYSDDMNGRLKVTNHNDAEVRIRYTINRSMYGPRGKSGSEWFDIVFVNLYRPWKGNHKDLVSHLDWEYGKWLVTKCRMVFIVPKELEYEVASTIRNLYLC